MLTAWHTFVVLRALSLTHAGIATRRCRHPGAKPRPGATPGPAANQHKPKINKVLGCQLASRVKEKLTLPNAAAWRRRYSPLLGPSPLECLHEEPCPHEGADGERGGADNVHWLNQK